MAKILVGPGKMNSWWLVVAREGGLVPLCTVSLGLIPRSNRFVGGDGVGMLHKHATETFSRHLAETDRLLTFMFNPETVSHIPITSRCTADPQAQVKFLDGFSWVNTGEKIPKSTMDQFFLGLGMEPHHFDRRLAGMAERRAIVVDVPIPIYGCSSGC